MLFQLLSGSWRGQGCFPSHTVPILKWNLDLVLAWLIQPPFEPFHKASLENLSLKTALLVAITSLRIVSELQALTVEEPYLPIFEDKVTMRTHPRFQSKVVPPFHIYLAISLWLSCKN